MTKLTKSETHARALAIALELVDAKADIAGLRKRVQELEAEVSAFHKLRNEWAVRAERAEAK